MLRLSKMTDYAVLLLAMMAETPNLSLTAAAAADKARLPQPTAAKLLKRLTRGGLLTAQRGASGGYALVKPPEQISVAEIVALLDGPVRLTDCADDQRGHCGIERRCAMRGQWDVLNRAIVTALASVTLADMVATRAPQSRGVEVMGGADHAYR